MDNFFTNASLATKLLAKRTILFGSIRSNRRELSQLENLIPKTVAYYNKTKFGFDVTDQQMVKKYSVKSKSYRWPVQVSFNILLVEELAEEYHEFLQEKKENLQEMLSDQDNISHLRKIYIVNIIAYNKLTIPVEKTTFIAYNLCTGQVTGYVYLSIKTPILSYVSCFGFTTKN
ncbi:piggyBac transposable element-derived protein 4-like [Vespula maculifrons]|uniref:PiggyBac transposable element-derived protein 4-like n=1 Tax=Vespula maculifrons TaxID=7453 RepID=A0ABD2CA66_VESMC